MAQPTEKSSIPRQMFTGSGFMNALARIWGTSSSCLTTGPTMSWGKKVTNTM